MNTVRVTGVPVGPSTTCDRSVVMQTWARKPGVQVSTVTCWRTRVVVNTLCTATAMSGTKMNTSISTADGAVNFNNVASLIVR